MRITPTKVVNVITGLVLLILIYSVFQHSSADHRNYDSTCDVSKEYQTKLHRMVYKTHDILDGLNLVHFLCYGSLFGQIRQSASLPWERDAELCVLNEEISQYDEVFMKRLFWKQGLDIFYDSAEGR